jgi:diguanylate cyclase (GGDEF)-like protein/PAS domain S-box-containing protein
MGLEPRGARQRYLSSVAIGFAAVPLAGYAVVLWLGKPDGFSLVQSWPGRLLMIFAAVWWVAGVAHFRQILSLAVPRKEGEAVSPATLSRCLGQLHSHYWQWLCAYAVIASLFYAIAGITDLAAPITSFEWAQFMLIQLIVALLVGMPFYLTAETSLGNFAAVAGLDKVYSPIESRVLLFGVLMPLLAGLALMYFYWWRARLWTAEELLVWSVLGILVLASSVLGLRGIYAAIRPLQTLLAARGALPRGLESLRPVSADEIGLVIQSLGNLGRSLASQGVDTQAVINAVPGAVIITDAAGRINTFNAVAENIFGYQADKLRGLSIRGLLPTLACEDGVPSLVQGEQAIRGRHHDGSTFPILVRMSKVKPDNNILYFCQIKDDPLSDKAQRCIQQTETIYRNLVESSRDLIWSMDKSGRWTFINSAAKCIYGVEAAELTGRSAHEFTEPDYLEREKAAFKALWQGKEWLNFDSVHRDSEGMLHHLHFIATASKDEHGEVVAINGIARDVTERKMYEQKLAYQATHDTLTGLFNRNYLRQELERMLARVARGNAGGVLMFVDLDQLKFINDNLGHAVGDRLLVETARLMKAHVREGDLLARYGGDEFTVLLYNTADEGARTMAENLRVRLGEYKFLEGGNVYSLTCSVGLALIDATVKSVDECLSQAERACNNAKTLGRNQVVFHAPPETKRADIQDSGWVDRIKPLMEEERFRLIYQPIMAVATGSIYDYEVLARMEEGEGHLLTPGAFLPTVERLGMSRQLDRCVAAKAIRQLAELRKAGQAVRFAINLTPSALADDALLRLLHDVLAETKLDASVLTFEIKETAAVTDLAAAADFIRAVKEMGARVALEHFGLGFSSFTYLKHLPVDALKIDGSYVQGLAQSLVNQVVVRSINQVAHALGKVTIAPQVENKEALTLVRDLGVDYVQGYFVGRPEQTIGVDRYITAALR